jgi:hypothetical protein
VHILGVGLSKTGTTSLHRALGILGYRSLHYDDQRLNDVVCGVNANPDFRRYDDVDAVLDIPAAWFSDELRRAYPACRCILTVRDEESWWNSIRAHFNERNPVRCPGDNAFKWALRNYVFGSAQAHEFLFRKRYREHNERMRQTIPADRLLVMDITAGDGWEKLCRFLDRPVPAVGFPHLNRQNELGEDYSRRAIAELQELVPRSSTFVLVDESTIDVAAIADRRALPFLERDGQYWGVPPDDATAISEFERMRGGGATHIVFACPAFWWLDHFGGFRRYLEHRYPCVCHSDRLVAFDLRGRTS